MLPQNKPDRFLFDDHRLVANAGLLLPATLARHLGLRELVDHHLDLGGAMGTRVSPDRRAGGTVGVLGCVVKAPLGTFLRSFRWGHVRQLDRVSRQLLARAWAAGAGPGDSPLTIDLDSTICGPMDWPRRGASIQAIPARAAITRCWPCRRQSEVLMSRLRKGRANTARGAAHLPA